MGQPRVYAISLQDADGSERWYMAPTLPGDGYALRDCVDQASFFEDLGEARWHYDRLVGGGHPPSTVQIFPVTLVVDPRPVELP